MAEISSCGPTFDPMASRPVSAAPAPRPEWRHSSREMAAGRPDRTVRLVVDRLRAAHRARPSTTRLGVGPPFQPFHATLARELRTGLRKKHGAVRQGRAKASVCERFSLTRQSRKPAIGGRSPLLPKRDRCRRSSS